MDKVLQEKIDKVVDDCWDNERNPEGALSCVLGRLSDIFYTKDEIANMITDNLYIDEDIKGRQAIVGIGMVAKWIAEGK